MSNIWIIENPKNSRIYIHNDKLHVYINETPPTRGSLAEGFLGPHRPVEYPMGAL
jgi:hypothetical protein